MEGAAAEPEPEPEPGAPRTTGAGAMVSAAGSAVAGAPVLSATAAEGAAGGGAAALAKARGGCLQTHTSAKAAKAAAPAPPSSAEDLFAAGQRVELAGLQSSAELNGQRGKVVTWAAEKQRYEISLASGAQLRVKPPNLRRVPHDDADVALDEDQPHGPQWAGHGTKDQLAELIQSHDASFRTRRPLLRDSDHLVQMMEAGLETTLRTDFCWSLNFTPRFLAHLCHEGFLPICSDLSGDAGLYTLMPKWHVERCCMRFADLHISKSARKRAKKFRLTVDRCFDVVVDRCVVRRTPTHAACGGRPATMCLLRAGAARGELAVPADAESIPRAVQLGTRATTPKPDASR